MCIVLSIIMNMCMFCIFVYHTRKSRTARNRVADVISRDDTSYLRIYIYM